MSAERPQCPLIRRDGDLWYWSMARVPGAVPAIWRSQHFSKMADCVRDAQEQTGEVPFLLIAEQV